MTLQRDDWDEDERRALAGLETEFEQLRTRHRDDPPFELLRAADADVLPEPLQAARRLDTDTFAQDISWYIAVAYERGGDRRRAPAELAALCGQNSTYASRAGEAAPKLQALNP